MFGKKGTIKNWTKIKRIIFISQFFLKVCRQLGIGPIARNLFSLRNFKKKYWYPPGHLLDGKEDKFEFRIRFKPSSLNRLRRIDSKAYEYFFQQVRLDVMENSVSEIVYEKHKSELIGLGVCDMYRYEYILHFIIFYIQLFFI